MNTSTDSIRFLCVNPCCGKRKRERKMCRFIWLGNQGEDERTLRFVL